MLILASTSSCQISLASSEHLRKTDGHIVGLIGKLYSKKQLQDEQLRLKQEVLRLLQTFCFIYNIITDLSFINIKAGLTRIRAFEKTLRGSCVIFASTKFCDHFQTEWDRSFNTSTNAS